MRSNPDCRTRAVLKPLSVFILALVACTHPAFAQLQNAPDKGDFACNCINQNGRDALRRETPDLITADCQRSACQRGSDGTQVMITLAPQCPTFSGDKTLGGLYLFAVPSALYYMRQPPPFKAYKSYSGVQPAYGSLIPHNPGDTWAGLSAHMINHYLQPFNINKNVKDPWLIIVNSDNDAPDAQLDMNVFPGDNGKCTLLVQNRAITERSPAGLLSVMGHELTHQLQFRRNYSSLTEEELAKIEEFITDFDELEARAWQKGIYNPGSPTWPAPFSNRGKEVYGCQTATEIKEIERAVDCNEWLVKQDMHRLKEKQTNGQVLMGKSDWDIMTRWMSLNPWAQNGWLPMHPKWWDAEDEGAEPYKSIGGCPR